MGQARQWQNQIDLAGQYPQLRLALGLHPYFLDKAQDQDLSLLSDYIVKHKNQLVAVGEIGLDKTIDIDWQQQLHFFTQQLGLAKTHALPVILHHRKSHNELIQTIKKQRFKHELFRKNYKARSH